MMQRQLQREELTNQAPRRSSVLELVLGTLHFLLGGSFVTILLIFLSSEGRSADFWYIVLGNLPATLMGLSTGLAGLLLLCRQRRVAVWFQWISTLAALILSVGTIYSTMNHRTNPFTKDSWIVVGIFCALPLWMAWFAWFIKKQEESAE